MTRKAHKAKKGALLATGTLFAIWAGLLAYMLVKQDHLTFPGSRTLLPPTPDHLREAEARLLSVTAEDGHSIQCFVVGDHDSKHVLLAFPGNGGDALEYALRLRDELHAYSPATSFCVIAPHYRGYGATGGKVHGPSMAADAQVLARTLQPCAIFGRSFGAGMAALAAAAWPAPALIVSPWDSLSRLARDYSRGLAPLRVLRRFFRHEIGVDSVARRAASPVRCLVFSDDTVIRKERSRAFFDAWSGPKTWVELPGKHHEDVGLSAEDAEFLLSELV
jgi:hypothetical protein